MRRNTARRRGGKLATLALAALLLAIQPLIAAAPSTTPMEPQEVMPILGRQVFGVSGDLVGRITDVLVDTDGVPHAAVLDVGGFLGLGNRVIAVHWSTLRFNPTDKDHPITISMPADEIKAAPQFTDPSGPAEVVIPTPKPPAPPPAPAPAAPAPAASLPATPTPATPAPATPAPATPTPAAPTPATPAPPAASK
jgi:hypothetical protein